LIPDEHVNVGGSNAECAYDPSLSHDPETADGSVELLGVHIAERGLVHIVFDRACTIFWWNITGTVGVSIV
jgi:hypothetical protein